MVAITTIKIGAGWLAENLPTPEFDVPPVPEWDLIEQREALTNATGKHPLWEGYAGVENYPSAGDKYRRANQVRTTSSFGHLYAWLAAKRQAKAVVEFGTAFGVSGMYWLAGLKRSPGSILYTFEPNSIWAALAEQNLRSISPAFKLTPGTFEEHAAEVLEGIAVDIAFIDAIHTSEFVLSQYAVLKKYMRPGGLVLFDDINFSDDMRDCWRTIANSPDVVTSASIKARVGIVELP